MINNSFNFHYLLNFHNLLFKPFNLDNWWNFFLDFDQSFDNGWHLNNSFNYVLNRNNFLDCSVIYHWLLERNIYNLLNLSDFFNFDNFFNYFVDGHNLGYFNNSFYDFLNYLFNFDYLWNHSENFQDIIDIDYSHNLLSNHSNNSLIHFRNQTSLGF